MKTIQRRFFTENGPRHSQITAVIRKSQPKNNSRLLFGIPLIGYGNDLILLFHNEHIVRYLARNFLVWIQMIDTEIPGVYFDVIVMGVLQNPVGYKCPFNVLNVAQRSDIAGIAIDVDFLVVPRYQIRIVSETKFMRGLHGLDRKVLHGFAQAV